VTGFIPWSFHRVIIVVADFRSTDFFNGTTNGTPGFGHSCAA
jgi:hypothetical protein